MNQKTTDAAGLGLNMFGQCIDFSVDENLEDTFATLKMKIIDIVYSLTIPKEDLLNQKLVEDAWAELMQQFFLRHAMGNSKVYKSGARDLSDEERKYLETRKRAEKSGLVLV